MPGTPAAKSTPTPHSRLSDPSLRRAVEGAVRRRVPGADADDIVQAAFADLLATPELPEDAEEFRRFVFGVARNKVFDHFRSRAHETAEDEAREMLAVEPPLAARDILRWAQEKLPDAEAEHTFEWMLREGDGEKLEHIAREAQLPAPRVRQRVSRLRRLFREHWALEVALTAFGLVLLATGAFVLYERARHKPEVAQPELRPEPLQSPEARGRELRRWALEQCAHGAIEPCLNGLDRARALDPTGDTTPEVESARRAAAAQLTPIPSAAPSGSAAPSASAPSKPVPRSSGVAPLSISKRGPRPPVKPTPTSQP